MRVTVQPGKTLTVIVIAKQTLEFFATDKAGNSEAVKTQIYTIQ
jgi:hypothetical protein